MTRKLAYWISTVITAISLLGALSYLTGSEQVVCLVRLPDSLYAYAPAVQVGKIEQPTRPIDVDADQCPGGIEIEYHSRHHLPRVGTGAIGEVDVERVGVGVVEELHWPGSRKLRSGNAL